MNRRGRRDVVSRLAAPMLAAFVVTCARVPDASPVAGTWWKGNMHTHSLWSDGDEFPEMIAAWYREQGYNFVAFTEHNILQEGERWIDIGAADEGWPPRNRSARAALPGYRARFGTEWVDERVDEDEHLVRLRPLAEYRDRFEEPGRFLLVMGEEITDQQDAHVNAIHLDAAIPPRGGADRAERILNNLRAVAERRAEAAEPVLAFVNHPNWQWALTAEEIAAIPEARLFEVYNGHLLIRNDGDDERAGTERIWDIVLALRHAAGQPPIHGLATDDAHHYRADSDTIARPGRGWVHVRAAELEPAALISALDAGDFYASTGVTLRDVRHDTQRVRIEIEPDAGVSYRTLFIGTRTSASLDGRPVIDAQGDTLRTTRVYGSDIGEVLAEVDGLVAEYAFAGDERYVRAKVVSSREKVDPTTGRRLGTEVAWTQPVVRQAP